MSYGRRGALVAVSLGVFCIQLDAFALNLALPTLGRELEVPDGHLQWVISGYLLSVGSFMLVAGRVSDLVGRRRVLLSGLAAFGAGSLCSALAPTLPLLIGSRVLQGIGGALIMPAGLALLTNLYPPTLRGRATGLALGLGGIATACGPFIGGVLTSVASWRAIFWVNVPLALAAITCLAKTAESRDNTASRRLDFPSLALATVALASVVGYVDRAPVWGWLAAPSLALIAVGFALAAVFVRRQPRAANPIIAPTLLANRPFMLLTAAGAVANTATVVFLFAVPLSLQGPRGLGPLAAGIAFLAPSVLMALAGPMAGRIRNKHAVLSMAASLAVTAATMLWAAHAASLGTYLVAVAMCGAALGLGNALTLVATQGLIDPNHAGAASGVTKTIITVAAGLGVVFAGPVAVPDVPASTISAALTAVALPALATAAILIALDGFARHSHRTSASRVFYRRQNPQDAATYRSQDRQAQDFSR